MFSSIRTRLTLSYLIVIVLAMGLSGFLLLSFLERYFLQATEDSLITQAQITAQALIPGATTRGPAGEVQSRQASLAPAYNTVQQQQLRNLSLQADNVLVPTDNLSPGEMDLNYLADASLQFSTQLETRIRILDTQGTVLVDSRQEEQGLKLQDDPLVEQALAGQYASRTDRADQGVMSLALPAVVENQLVGVVYLSQPLDDVSSVLYGLRTRWLLSTAIALLLSGVVGLLLSRAIASPVRRLTAAAGAVAQGQFDQHVPVQSHDELGRLSRAFNQMTDHLRAARQMQVDFVANVSHELRTPLTSIKGMVETLRAGAVNDLEVRDRFLKTVDGETDRLIRLVNDLLLLTRADSDALNLHCQPVNLTELARTVIDRLTPQAGAQSVVIKLEATPDVPLAWADPDRIAQVLLNLLDNAIKYSRPGGLVTVHAARGPERSVQMQVIDQGVGIPAEALPHIGQRFYRADKARARSEGGSGLGLAIAQALVTAHGGQLWLASQEGQGTTVNFTLPASNKNSKQ